MHVNMSPGNTPITIRCTVILNMFKLIYYERAFVCLCVCALPLFVIFPGSRATLAHGSIDVYLFTVHLMLLSCISHSVPPRL